MATRVFIAGLLPHLMDDFRERLAVAEVDLISGTGVEELAAALAAADIDHVIIGGGLGLPARLDMVRTVFESSDRATVHMKDHRSGPEGFVPFVRSVLHGLADYHPAESTRAVLRAQRT
ncbi:hypothetical protein Drose_24290 [Dactylosporangium roseum]|uniref:Uncharacterized protein n=1 Tax=Dactylosporangium roseum TaxID=47989 RepID=A0ABY5Z0F3_9ACTN|nr:hypothetical protein [Dactylosporangium roseum]UWZ34347.1 hypothetical protein Drose_24290 [Dactylosporangium roseum]